MPTETQGTVPAKDNKHLMYIYIYVCMHLYIYLFVCFFNCLNTHGHTKENFWRWGKIKDLMDMALTLPALPLCHSVA